MEKGPFERSLYCILGLPFDAINMDAVCSEIMSASESKRKLFLSTPNLNWLRMSADDPEFREANLKSGLSIPDGFPVVLVGKILGIPLAERVAGSDIICALGKKSPCRLFFFGGEDGVAEAASEKLRSSGLKVIPVGSYSPGFSSVEDMSSAEIIRRINDTDPDFVVVALGAKKGQEWIERNREKLNASVVSHLGATINFIAETKVRAPLIVQKLYLEWAWRIWQEPALSNRYFLDALYFFKALLFKVAPYKFYLMFKAPKSGEYCEVKVDALEGIHNICLKGAVSGENVSKLSEICSDAVRAGKAVSLDIRLCTFLDFSAIGKILTLRNVCKEKGLGWQLLGRESPVSKLFKYNDIEYLFEN